MSLVYNNDKPIGKCESYSIDKIPGTTPFVMLTNYEPLRSELNENQQVVLDWLKREAEKRCDSPLKMIQRFVTEGLHKRLSKSVYDSYLCLTEQEQFQILLAFAEWGMKEVAE